MDQGTIRVPAEIVDHIIALVLASSAHSFASIASVSLASSDFRRIALRLFFSTITASSRTRWSKLWNVLASADRDGDYTNSPHTWVRRVMISSQSLVPVSSCLFAFTNLQSLYIDFANEDGGSQDMRLKSIFQPDQPLSLAFLTSLTLTSIVFINKGLLEYIAESLPLLQVLKISCTERLDVDSSDGFIQAAQATLHSPVPYTYKTSSDLASAFAGALQRLTNIKHLHFGIFLSSDEFFRNHMMHYNLADLRIEGSKASDVFLSCSSCSGVCGRNFYGPEICKLCQAHADITREEEKKASLVLANALPNIKSVGWSSFFVKTRNLERKRMPNQVDLERETTVWIIRTGEKAVGTSIKRVEV